MKDIRIVDTHLHVWDPGLLRYSWLDDVTLLNRSYLLDDYDRETDGIPIDAMVFVQCEVDREYFRDEASWVLGLAQQDRRIAGVVPWAPLELGHRASDVLDEFASEPLIKGIRRIIQFEEAADFCLAPEFVSGVRLLGERDLHFEICIKGDEQFRNVIRLVDACPDVRFILNHIGKPFIADRRIEPWAGMIRELAERPTVWCKVSGMANEADMQNWGPDDLAPYFETVVGAFGWGRLVFGGDWPVALLATGYRRWVETATGLATAAGAGADELRALLSENARTFYRLDS